MGQLFQHLFLDVSEYDATTRETAIGVLCNMCALLEEDK